MNSYACIPPSRSAYRRPASVPHKPYTFRSISTPMKKSMVAAGPLANIIRDEKAYLIELAVPGMTREQIRIELQQDQLVVTGTATPEQAQPRHIRREFTAGPFTRTFRLHKQADVQALTASFDNGILTITIPDATPETIKINIQ